MQRLASHYIYCKQLYRMHYLEISDAGEFEGLYPLSHEIAGTAFYDGLILPVVSVPDWLHQSTFSFSYPLEADSPKSPYQQLGEWLTTQSLVQPDLHEACDALFLLNRLTLTTSELGTNNGCCHGYIQRL